MSENTTFTEADRTDGVEPDMVTASNAPASVAPRLAASITPGPPPVAMTLSRGSPMTPRRAPPRSDASLPKARACSTQRPLGPASPSLARAVPNTTMVERTPQARSASSAFAYSSRNRTPRMESPNRKS